MFDFGIKAIDTYRSTVPIAEVRFSDRHTAYFEFNAVSGFWEKTLTVDEDELDGMLPSE